MTQNDSEKGIYNVKAISKKIGIQPGTLRAWERRYQIVTPKRNEVGHRIYSEQDLAILKWLVDKVNQGFTISQAVELLSEKTKESPSLFTTDEILDSKKKRSLKISLKR
ncbi:MerR family transcriptional regulator [Tepidibacillus marianensis]|uniref:MerR family transcriptional regulator n=1 Tax=Tepidibacillus marianensis TaxID=3131995 RepID=UPI0030D0A35A